MSQASGRSAALPIMSPVKVLNALAQQPNTQTITAPASVKATAPAIKTATAEKTIASLFAPVTKFFSSVIQSVRGMFAGMLDGIGTGFGKTNNSLLAAA